MGTYHSIDVMKRAGNPRRWQGSALAEAILTLLQRWPSSSGPTGASGEVIQVPSTRYW